MPYQIQVELHTAHDPHHLYTVATRILGALPGGAQAAEQAQGEGRHTITSLPNQNLSGTVTVHYRDRAPYHRPGATGHGRQVHTLTTVRIGGETPVSRPAVAANYILRLGAWLEGRDHLWSWHHPERNDRYRGTTKFAGIADLFPPDRAPNQPQIHDQLLASAYEANYRDNL